MDPINKFETNKAALDQKAELVVTEKQDGEISKTVENISGGINVLSDGNDVDINAKVSDSDRAKSESASQSSGNSFASSSTAQVTDFPSVDEMIKQTLIAIEFELKKKEQEVKSLMSKNSTKPVDLNNATRDLRLLYNILYQLKNAARQASDFIVNLWKQYVNKVS